MIESASYFSVKTIGPSIWVDVLYLMHAEFRVVLTKVADVQAVGRTGQETPLPGLLRRIRCKVRADAEISPAVVRIGDMSAARRGGEIRDSGSAAAVLCRQEAAFVLASSKLFHLACSPGSFTLSGCRPRGLKTCRVRFPVPSTKAEVLVWSSRGSQCDRCKAADHKNKKLGFVRSKPARKQASLGVNGNRLLALSRSSSRYPWQDLLVSIRHFW